MPPERRQSLIDGVMRYLLLELKGATHVQGTGYFVDEATMHVHKEDVTLCYSFCQDLSTDRLKEINEMANGLAIEFNQLSIAVEVDNVMYLFQPTQVYRDVYAAQKKKGRHIGWLKHFSAGALKEA